jgi:drug/metabolite transporter (DMT)-like permease
MRHMGEDVPFFGMRENRLKLISRGLCGATAMTLYYYSIQLLPLGDAVTIFFTNVIVTAIASVSFGYERASWIMALGCSACVGTL